MSLEAIAILHVPPAAVQAALPAAEQGARTAVNGESLEPRPLEDATLIPLGVSLTAAPEALAERARALLGDLLEAHGEERGIPVFPASHELEASTWAAAMEELGEAADWVRVARPAPEAAFDPMAMMGALGDPSALLGQAQHMLGGADPAQLLAQLGSEDPGALMQQAMQMMGQLAESGQLSGLMSAFSDAMPPGGIEQAMQGMAAGELDLDALKANAEAAMAAQPELAATLRSALGDDED